MCLCTKFKVVALIKTEFWAKEVGKFSVMLYGKKDQLYGKKDQLYGKKDRWTFFFPLTWSPQYKYIKIF